MASALERYQKEVLRVLGVLDSVLSKKQWLVGDKCSVADLSFITYVLLYDPSGTAAPSRLQHTGGTILRLSPSSRTITGLISRRTSRRCTGGSISLNSELTILNMRTPQLA